MKKPLALLTGLAACAGALAQSSVTLFGVVDATLARGTGSISDMTQLTHSGNANSRIGFRGVEDLGGGAWASFWLESGINVDSGQGQATNTNNQASGAAGSGALTFNRRSTVSLGGRWGELRLGRDFNPQFWNISTFDPFGNVGAGGNQVYVSSNVGLKAPTTVRASNSIGYFLPASAEPFYGQAMYYLGENPSGSANAKDGTGWGVRAGYASGNLNVAIATSRTRYAAGDVSQSNAGLQWNFGFARLMGMISRDDLGTSDGKGWLLGAVVPAGNGEFRVSYSRYTIETGAEPTSAKVALGFVHNLSKRTALYTTLARVRNSGGATAALNGAVTAPNTGSSGFDLGIRHNF
jgi:predicted porin